MSKSLQRKSTIDAASPVSAAGGEPSPMLMSRGAAIAAGAVLFFAVIVFYAGARMLAVIGLVFTDGFMALVWLASAAAVGAVLLGAMRVPCRGALGAATAAGAGMGLFSLAAFGLGCAGWLNRVTAIVLVFGGGVAGAIWLLRGAEERRRLAQVHADRWLRQRAGAHWLWVVGAAFLGIVVVGDSIMPGLLWKPDDPHPYDVLEYHLQIPREWYESGRIEPLKHNVFSYFPMNGEMQYLLAMHVRGGPWAGMYLCQFLSLASMAAAALAIFGATRGDGTNRKGPGAAIVASMAFIVTPWISMLASTAYVESALLMYVALAAAWALRAVDDPKREMRCMALAGVFAGLACGVKYTAAPFVLGGIAVASVLTSIGKPRGAIFRSIRATALFGAVGVAVFSPWPARNWAATGNPVFPLAMRWMGQGHFTAAQVDRFEQAHSPTPAQRTVAGRLAAARDEIALQWQYGYVLWPAAAAGALLAWRRRGTWFLAAAMLVMLIVWIGFTHLISRFFVMAIPLAAILIGRGVGERAWAGGIVILLGAAISLSGVHRRMEPYAALAQNGLYGLDDPLLTFPLPELHDIETDGHTHVSLVGMATPFLHIAPMSRMSYRTVFDVDAQGRDFVDAWLDPGQTARQPDRVLVISPPEIARLAKTYLGIPPVPAGMETREPYLERR